MRFDQKSSPVMDNLKEDSVGRMDEVIGSSFNEEAILNLALEDVLVQVDVLLVLTEVQSLAGVNHGQIVSRLLDRVPIKANLTNSEFRNH